MKNCLEMHLSIGHGSRNRTEYEINKKYKNILRKIIMCYLNLYGAYKKKEVPKN